MTRRELALRLEARHWAQEEFGRAELGYCTRTLRLVALGAKASLNPSGRVTEVCRSEADRQAAYDFLESEAFDVSAMTESIAGACRHRQDASAGRQRGLGARTRTSAQGTKAVGLDVGHQPSCRDPARGRGGDLRLRRIERIKYLSRSEPELPAKIEFSTYEIKATIMLKRSEKKRTEQVPNRMPTMGQITRWIADLGGYAGKSSGGPPGSTVIGRGLERVEVAALVLQTLAEDNRTRAAARSKRSNKGVRKPK